MESHSIQREGPDNRSGPFTQAHLRTQCVNTSTQYSTAEPLPVTNYGDNVRGKSYRPSLFLSAVGCSMFVFSAVDIVASSNSNGAMGGVFAQIFPSLSQPPIQSAGPPGDTGGVSV